MSITAAAEYQHKASNVIDMHCDTLMKAFLDQGPDSDIGNLPDCAIDLGHLVNAGAMAQFLAIYIVHDVDYTERGRKPLPVDEYIEGCAKIFRNTMERHGDLIAPARNAAEIEANHKAGKVSGVLAMEDGVAVNGSMEKLDDFYDLGIRALTLTWNFENCFGFPNSRDPHLMQKGLKPFGKEAVEHMQEIGMLVDVSHLSDGGFYDVASLARKPFIATHSNCRALCHHPRNLTDDMIRILAEHGGVMGINFEPSFLEDTPDNETSRIERMVAMALHEREIGGTDIIAIGTDFDGIGGNLEVAHPNEMYKLLDALSAAGFSSGEIDKITHENILRVMRDAVG